MKGRDERKSKISLSDKIALAALLLAACDFILNWTPFLFRLPRFFLVMIFLALLWSLAVFVRDSWKEISKICSERERKLHRLCVEARKDEQLLLQYGLQADCLRKEYNKRIREQLKRGMKRLAVQTGILLMFSLGNYRPLAAFGQDFLRICGIGQESSGQPPDELSQEVSQEKGDGIEEAERENTEEVGQKSTGEAGTDIQSGSQASGLPFCA